MLRAAAEGDNSQVRILVVGSIICGIKDAYIVIEKKVLFHATKLTDVVRSSFPCFCIQLSYVALFLEHVLLQKLKNTLLLSLLLGLDFSYALVLLLHCFIMFLFCHKQ